jgi:hypothetical protein
MIALDLAADGTQRRIGNAEGSLGVDAEAAHALDIRLVA